MVCFNTRYLSPKYVNVAEIIKTRTFSDKKYTRKCPSCPPFSGWPQVKLCFVYLSVEKYLCYIFSVYKNISSLISQEFNFILAVLSFHNCLYKVDCYSSVQFYCFRLSVAKLETNLSHVNALSDLKVEIHPRKEVTFVIVHYTK